MHEKFWVPSGIEPGKVGLKLNIISSRMPPDSKEIFAAMSEAGNHTVKRVVHFLIHINQQVGPTS